MRLYKVFSETAKTVIQNPDALVPRRKPGVNEKLSWEDTTTICPHLYIVRLMQISN
jgi:hypothetical protein